MSINGIPKAAVTAIDDLLDHCAGIQKGQEVLVLAQLDGLYGGILSMSRLSPGFRPPFKAAEPMLPSCGSTNRTGPTRGEFPLFSNPPWEAAM